MANPDRMSGDHESGGVFLLIAFVVMTIVSLLIYLFRDPPVEKVEVDCTPYYVGDDLEIPCDYGDLYGEEDREQPLPYEEL